MLRRAAVAMTLALAVWSGPVLAHAQLQAGTAAGTAGSGAPSGQATTQVSGVPGLHGAVQVLFDGAGVPHITAGSDADAAFAAGYVQARDRLFQMDVLRKTARGRLGELLGADPAVAAQDVFLRTMFTSRQTDASGSHHVEDLIAAQLSPGLRAVLQRFADGVNRWLDDVEARPALLHPQYLPLGFTAAEIAPWTVEDTVAIGRLQSFELSDSSQLELLAGELAVALGITGDPRIADLGRHAQSVPSVILAPGAAGSRASSALSPAAVGAPSSTAQAASMEGARALRRSLRLPLSHGDRAGSNNWTLMPQITASGRTLVANDPHLTLPNPANFYMMQLTTPTRNVAGVVFPGTPAVAIGHNERIAWGETVVPYDVSDLYLETLDSGAQPTAVLYQGAWVKLTPVIETRRVRAGPGQYVSQQYPILIVPHRGPIFPGSISGGTSPAAALSVRWTGQDPTFEIQAFFDLDAARSVDEAFQALTKFGVGSQNFNFGDVDGHIGYDPHARVPIHGDEAKGCLPWLPMDGSTDTCDWKGFIPDDQLPQEKDPPRRFIVTANNDITGALVAPPCSVPPCLDADPLAALPYLYWFTDPGFRAQRIQKQLEAASGPPHTLDGMTILQADNHSELAETMMPGLLGLLQGGSLSAGAQSVVDLWKGWNFSTPRGDEPTPLDVGASSAASATFHVFLTRFVRALVAPFDHAPFDAIPLGGTRFGDLVRSIPAEQLLKVPVALTQQPYPLYAPPALWCSGACADLVAGALEDTVARPPAAFQGKAPRDWRWGDLHEVRFGAIVPGLTPDFGPFPNDGGLLTVDVANFDLFDDTFEQGAGPNVRMATELALGRVRSRMVIPGGQSDRPGGPHYEDQVPAWLVNPLQPGDQPFYRDEVARAAVSRILFTD